MRARQRKPIASLSAESDLGPGNAPGLGEERLLEAYERSLLGLSPDLRAAFVLHETEGMSYREVADVLGCPIGTVVYVFLHRGEPRS